MEKNLTAKQIDGFLQSELQRPQKISETKAFLMATVNFIREIWQLFIIKTRLRMAIKMADMKHFINDRKYYVLPEKNSGGLMVVSRQEVKIHRKRNTIDRATGAVELSQMSFYHTPVTRNAKDGITFKDRIEARNRYIRWQKTLNPVFNKMKVGTPVYRK
jgi:hypothetical protein